MQKLVALIVLSCVFFDVPCRTIAEDAGIEFFEKKIRPALVEHCQECHSVNAKKLGGGLLLDHRDGARMGGDSGAAVVPGKPDGSLLIKAIRYNNDSVKMPPKGKLPASVIADFETWVKQGALDPREKPTQSKIAKSWEETFRERANWWSLQTTKKPAIPQPKNADWSAHPVDRFLLAKLEEQGLTPAVPADPHTLARRLSLVLTGLPPNVVQAASLQLPDSITKRITDNKLEWQAGNLHYEKFVDVLLDSPHFGEQWARHWMDVVRFSETHGNEWNYEVHHAWQYRDYLIRAFNADVPYDQFIREHIAGDLLTRPRQNAKEQFNESIIGTGFYRFGEVNHDDCISLRSIGYDLIDNQIDTLTKAFQATTVACARCHNHKLDAISMEDYYGLLAVLRSSRQVSHCIDSPEVNAALKRRLLALKIELRRELAATWLAETQQITRFVAAAHAKRAKLANADELANGLNPQRLGKWVAAIAAEKQPFDDPLQTLRVVLSVEPALLGTEWHKLAEQTVKEDRDRSEFNQTQFVTFADFRLGTGSSPVRSESATSEGKSSTSTKTATGGPPVATDWQIGGQSLSDAPSRSGDFVMNVEGDTIVRAILPAGRFTHSLSDKLNGTLRSPVLPLGKQKISFQVLGQRSSALRLVSNNCQLNYQNYRALTSSELQWITFSPPPDRDSLQTYAELMTMFDNPKFPDQLSALGGDGANYKLPWEKAAENPRSYFGVTRVVLHDVGEPPKPDVTHLLRLFGGDEPKSLTEVSARYATVIEAALRAWAEDKATDDDARWLDGFLKRELLGNNSTLSSPYEALVKEYRRVEAELSLPRVVAGMSDGGAGIEQPVFVRGDCQKPGPAVPRQYLEVLAKSREPFTSVGSGRLELAERIAAASNPLTARVIVNRVWQHLFGTGLVRSVDDFGHVGELPSHPELLDYLANQFVAEGWSVKKLIRSLVLSRAFQLSNQPSQAARDIDPQNRLLQHYSARRLEAEGVRDSILATSGRLDLRLFGMSVQPFREKEYADRRLFPGPLDGAGRRSVYIKNNLMESPKFLSAFNFPGGKVTQGRRDVTNVPAQALALLNDPFVLQQADAWAARLILRPDDTVTKRITFMFETAVNRPPTVEELTRFEQAVVQLADLHQVAAADSLKSQLLWKDMAHAMFNLNEFIYVP
ncbi:MAG: PSD1 and planctomycete cytochrome C domain-containing protein [Planctomycetia bacterium]|nr:PSD1 and planctomycete cytochrome C domain-containing protein [Planctomycetia bacterium]